MACHRMTWAVIGQGAYLSLQTVVFCPKDGFLVIWGEVMAATGCLARPDPTASTDKASKAVAVYAGVTSNYRQVC
jgi:hypothetical protein